MSNFSNTSALPKTFKKLIVSAGATLMFFSFPTLAQSLTIDILPQNTIQLDAYKVTPVRRQGVLKQFDSVEGTEKSECGDDFHKTSATGTADIQIIDKRTNGITFSIFNYVSTAGGSYQTCISCANILSKERCLGINPNGPNDTKSDAKAASTAIVAIKFPIDFQPSNYVLAVGTATDAGRPPVVIVTDQNDQPLTPSKTTPSSYEFRAEPGTIFYLKASLDVSASSVGESTKDARSAFSRIDVDVRKAAILASLAEFEPFIVGGEETKSI